MYFEYYYLTKEDQFISILEPMLSDDVKEYKQSKIICYYHNPSDIEKVTRFVQRLLRPMQDEKIR